MTRHPPITASSLFVVSGGARGITAQCVIRMAQVFACRFLLLGRSAQLEQEPAFVQGSSDTAELRQRIGAELRQRGEHPTPVAVQRVLAPILASREISATLQAVAQAGGHATYLQVDITERASLQQHLLAALHDSGPVTGLLHGAGRLSDRLIQQKSLDDFERVYAPKVIGLQNLLDCIPPRHLRYLLLFSSVAGFYGNVGQADYALANEVLNKTALQVRRAHPACRVIAFNWGPWDRGMVSAELKQLFEQHQVAVIPTPHGTQMLIDELRSEHSEPLVVLGSPIRTTREPLDSVLHMLRERRSMMGDPAPAAALPPAVWRIRRTLHLERNPFLRDHVIGSHAVLPTAFAAAWLVNSCEQLHPGYLFSALEDLKVLKGIVFEQAAPPEYILEIKRLPSASQSDEADELRFDVLLWSEPAPGKYHYHYSGSIRLRRHLPAVPQLSPAEQQRFEQAARTTPPLLDGATLYRDGTLFHGPLLQGIQSVLQISQTTLVMRCHLPPVSLAQQGQFPIQTFNPYAVDVCVQSMPVWLRHQRAASVLPMGVRSIEQFRPLPCGVPFAVSLSLEQCSEERLIAQLAAHDLQGQLYMRLAGAEGVISSRLLRLLAGGGAD